LSSGDARADGRVATAVRHGCPAQRDVFAQAPDKGVVLSRRGELLQWCNARIDA